MKYYAGIGSRETPDDVLRLMVDAACWLSHRDWTLRSGHAVGADRAFEIGAAGKAVIYLPWNGFGTQAYKADSGMKVLGRKVCLSTAEYAQKYRSLVDAGIRNDATASQVAQSLHGRNWCQVFGHSEHDKASVFVLCWCREVNGRAQGGTATAVNLAELHGIEVINLWHKDQRERLESKLLSA